MKQINPAHFFILDNQSFRAKRNGVFIEEEEEEEEEEEKNRKRKKMDKKTWRQTKHGKKFENLFPYLNLYSCVEV